MKIEYQNTIDDCIAFNRFVFWNNPNARLGYRFVLFIIPTIIVVIAVVLIISLPPWTWLTYTLSAMFFVLVVSWFLVFPKQARKTMDNDVRKMMDSGKFKGIIGKHTVAISENGIQEKTDVNQSFYEWNGILNIKQDESHMYVFINPAMAYIIPKRSFADEESATTFYSTIKEHYSRANGTTA